jgi:hypothetical protein
LVSKITDLFPANFDRHYACYYRKNASSLLNQLCDKYGSDKGEIRTEGHPYPWPSHSYADFMERTFGHCRQHIRNVFECGLGTNNPSLASSMGVDGKPGASLRVWRDYFPKAKIIGADIDRDILFTEDRISTFYCDQTDSAAIAQLWDNVQDVEFDLMIDDGLHTYAAGVSLLENSFHKLKKGGVYVIEDVSYIDLYHFLGYFLGKDYNFEFVTLYRKGLPLADNSLVVIRK